MKRLLLLPGGFLLVAGLCPSWSSEEYGVAVTTKRVRELEIGLPFSPLYSTRRTEAPTEAGSADWRAIDWRSDLNLLSFSMLCVVGGYVLIHVAVRRGPEPGIPSTDAMA